MRMDATGFNVGAKAALGTIKDSIAIGKEGAKLIQGIRGDNQAEVATQQKARVQARKQEQNMGSWQEQKAYNRFIEVTQNTKASADLKESIIKNHGKKGWEEFLRLKAEIEKQDADDAIAIHTDEDRIANLAWWCFGIAAIIVYFLVVF